MTNQFNPLYKYIQNYLLENNIGILEFSDKADISYRTINNIKEGKRKCQDQTYFKLSKILNTNPDYLKQLYENN